MRFTKIIFSEDYTKTEGVLRPTGAEVLFIPVDIKQAIIDWVEGVTVFIRNESGDISEVSSTKIYVRGRVDPLLVKGRIETVSKKLDKVSSIISFTKN